MIQYLVISPVRNEEQHLPQTVESMAAQTVKPALWIIVDDGSSDRTAVVAEKAAGVHPWIRVIHRSDRGYRKAGGGVVDAFYEGLKAAGDGPWDFIAKLDGDLSFQGDYFEKCFEAFENFPHLGIAGGTVCLRTADGLAPEVKGDPRFHVRGATKIYRAACWRDIGGLLRAPGWDTLDEVKANMLGWETRTLPELELLHHRPTGAAYGAWNDRVKAGLANYICGYHPFFMVVKCVRRLLEPPYLIGGLGIFCGFVKGYLKRVPRVDDGELIRYFRRQQLNRLLGRPSLWR